MEECNVHCLGGISHALFSDSSTNVQQGPHLGKAGKETQGIQIQYEGFGGPRCCFCLTPPMDHVSASSNAPMDHLMDLSKNSFLVSPDMSILRIIYYCIYINIYMCVWNYNIYEVIYIYILIHTRCIPVNHWTLVTVPYPLYPSYPPVTGAGISEG